MQLESLAQSEFDPLSRTYRFMLTEEAHHMFVGKTGVGRLIQRTCEAMQEAGIEDPYEIDRVRELGCSCRRTAKRVCAALRGRVAWRGDLNKSRQGRSQKLPSAAGAWANGAQGD